MDSDIDVPLTSMSADDLRQLRNLYEQSRAHYVKMLESTDLKEGDLFAIKLCMTEVDKEIEEIDAVLANKN